MAVLKVIQSKGNLMNIIKYVTNREKTDERIISGIGCNSTNAYEVMKQTKVDFAKEGGRTYTHIIQSFRPGEISSDDAHDIGIEFAKEFKEHQVLVATHKDKEHIHNHFVINSVSFADGKKLHTSKSDLRLLKERNNDICRERGLSTIDKPFGKFFYSMGEYKLAEKGESLWKEQLRGAIDEAKANTKDLLGFSNYLKDYFNIDIKLQEKNVSYKHPDKQKFTRGKKLGSFYTIGGLKYYFYVNPGHDFDVDFSKHKKTSKVNKEFSLSKELLSSIENIPKKIARDIEKEKIRVEKIKKYKDISTEREKVRSRERERQ
jgi:hypothetical protein